MTGDAGAPHLSHRRAGLHRIGAPTAAVLFAALLPVALVACGGGSSSTPSFTEAKAGSGRRAEQLRRFGHEAPDLQASEAEGVLSGYLVALASGEWSRACSYLTDQIRQLRARFAEAKHLEGGGCAAGVEESIEALPGSQRSDLERGADVVAVRVEGDRGYAIYEDGADAERSMPIRSESRGWKLIALPATGAPLGGSE